MKLVLEERGRERDSRYERAGEEVGVRLKSREKSGVQRSREEGRGGGGG